MRKQILSDRAVNERIVRMGRNRNLDWGRLPASQTVPQDVRRAVDAIDFDNLRLTPHEDIGVRYNRYPVQVDNRKFEVEIIQPINRKTRRYDVTLMGGDDVEYLNSIDLDKTTAQEAREYIRGEMVDYIKKYKR